ncbi:hypothetical protein B7R21_07275 [Subtercola boreus]|uniref:Uncharacterized protein n=1 Tax=Subtercola boreus TaxID=120213 RepID=A0A3E0VVJ6_9MICO|nr:hypothetical protein [Subtercola boreus]RFA13866.1 hypothetical protein B7R21_07275 [Subtercola boreus]
MKTNDEFETTGAKRLIERRTVVRTAAWSVPAIALAIGVPAHAASGDVNVGAFTLTATSGLLGLIVPGFRLKAGTVALPVGTTVAITGNGLVNVGVIGVTGGTASANVLSPTSALYTLTSELAAGATISFLSTVSINLAFAFSAVAALPTGYMSTGAKSSAGLSCTAVLCSAT